MSAPSSTHLRLRTVYPGAVGQNLRRGALAVTETITVLFTDLVGSTEISYAISPDAADELRRAHFSTLRRAVADSGGVEVKGLGDGVMVVFRSTSAALSCAVAMQQAVHRDNVGARRQLGLRIGLSGGEATMESDDYYGDPVIEAARLCAHANAGQILATDAVRVMCGRRSPYLFERLSALELKGLPEPVAVLGVRWEPFEKVAAEDGVPLPARLTHVPLTGVVARETEAALLTDAYKRAAAGEGRAVVLVSGDAGVGKTTLVAEAARRASNEGACVLLGRCQEDVSAPYLPFAEVLHHYAAHAPEHVLRTHVEIHGGDIASMVPALAQRLGHVPAPTRTDPDTERYLLYGAVAGLLTAASLHQPTVLVLDDLQWSDSQSLRLLRHVVTTVESARLLVLGTFRDTELSPSNPLRDLLGALQREPGISRIELTGFDDAGVLSFMEAAAGQRLEDAATDLAHALCLETEGNPFFVGEVLRSLTETGTIYQDDRGRWTVAGEMSEMVLPTSVREVISARVGRLGAQAGQVLSMAAVIGRDFDFDLLHAVTDLSQEEVLDVLDSASAAALVRDLSGVPGRYSFSHALTQHTLYQGLPSVRRTRAHQQVAEAIEATVGEAPGARVGELAHHWLTANQPANATKAIGYARQAGEAALAALAPDDAVRYFSRALQLVEMAAEDDPLVGCDLRLALGEAQRQAGMPGFRETFLDAAHRAQELDATDRLVAAALGNSRGFFSSVGVIDADKVAVLESALDALGDEDGRERALLLATLCSELALGTTLDRRKELADAARAMARRLKDPDTVIRTLNLVCDPLQVPSTLNERMVDAKEALEMSELLGDPDLLFWTGAYSRLAAVQAGDFEMARRCLATMRAVNRGLRQPTMMWVTLFNDAADALLGGDSDRAEQLATAALEIGTESGQPDAFGFYGAEMIGVRRQQGRYGELVPLIEQIVAENPALPVFRATLAEGHMEAGNVDTARQMLDAAAADLSLLPYDVVWIFAVASYADVAAELRAEAAARLLLDLLAPFDDQVLFIGATAGSPVAYYCGSLESVLGLYNEAERHFAEAAEINARGQLEFADAATHLRWGRMLSARGGPGDLERARDLLAQANDAAVSRGYASIARRATAALADLTDAG
jgi:class 3 adenylate cyclase/tetratricopeptide (TPR) repeat protein